MPRSRGRTAGPRAPASPSAAARNPCPRRRDRFGRCRSGLRCGNRAGRTRVRSRPRCTGPVDLCTSRRRCRARTASGACRRFVATIVRVVSTSVRGGRRAGRTTWPRIPAPAPFRRAGGHRRGLTTCLISRYGLCRRRLVQFSDSHCPARKPSLRERRLSNLHAYQRDAGTPYAAVWSTYRVRARVNGASSSSSCAASRLQRSRSACLPASVIDTVNRRRSLSSRLRWANPKPFEVVEHRHEVARVHPHPVADPLLRHRLLLGEVREHRQVRAPAGPLARSGALPSPARASGSWADAEADRCSCPQSRKDLSPDRG